MSERSRGCCSQSRTAPAPTGYSLVELLVTIVLVGFVMAAMVPLFAFVLKQNGADAARNVALNIAQDRIEKIRQLDFDDITAANLASSTFYSGQFGPTFVDLTSRGSKTYHIAYDVNAVHPSSDSTAIAYKQVAVTVTWQGPPFPLRPVELKTVIYRQWAGPQTMSVWLDPAPSAPGPEQFPSAAIADLFQNEQWITDPSQSGLSVRVFINPDDAPSMSYVNPTSGQVQKGWVSVVITSADGSEIVPAQKTTDPVPTDKTLYTCQWTLRTSTGDAVPDGVYTISVTAFSYEGSQGNTVTLHVRLETGAPPAVTGLYAGGSRAGDGSGQAILTWSQSPAADLMYYEVRRFDSAHPDGLIVAGGYDTPSRWLTTNAVTDVGLAYGETSVTYEVYAVDQTYRYSAVATTQVDWTSAGYIPGAPTDLSATTDGSSVVLSWQQPYDPSQVSGYQVFEDGSFIPLATVTTLSYSYDQGYGSTHFYQVRSINESRNAFSDWSSIASGQPSTLFGSDHWLVVTIGAEPLFNIDVFNQGKKPCSTVTLWYTGPAGTSPRRQVCVWTNLPSLSASPVVTGQHAGWYEVDWQAGGKSGSPTFQVTPTSPLNVEFKIG